MAEDSSDDVERTSLTAGKIPDVASAGPFKRPGVLISAVGTHVAAVALLAMMWHTLKKALSPEAPLLTWRTFPLHPFLMTLAFGFLSPVAAAAWRSYEHLLGFTHRQVKVFHGVLMGVAALTGLLGVIDMWLVHEDGAAAQAATRASPGPRRGTATGVSSRRVNFLRSASHTPHWPAMRASCF